MWSQTLKHKLFRLLLVLDYDQEAVRIAACSGGCWLWELSWNNALRLYDLLVKRILKHQRRLRRNLRLPKRSYLTLIHIVINPLTGHYHRWQSRHYPIIIIVIAIIILIWLKRVRARSKLLIEMKLIVDNIWVWLMIIIRLTILITYSHATHHPRL